MMNLAVPPFDDIHVRRALNYALDKQRLVELQGGPSAAEPVGHLASDRDEDNLLARLRPVRDAGGQGGHGRGARGDGPVEVRLGRRRAV